MAEKITKSPSDYSAELMEMYKQNSDASIHIENTKNTENITDNTSTQDNQNNTEEIKEENYFQGNEVIRNQEELFAELGIVTGCGDSKIYNKRGYLKVKVSTADDALAVEGAIINVTCFSSGEAVLIGSYITDSSGQTEIITLPAPDKENSESPGNNYPAAFYDVTAKKEGFFDFTSKDVPILEGITSLQNFNLIPVPYVSEQTDGGVIYNNI